jgi:hypothetical protein
VEQLLQQQQQQHSLACRKGWQQPQAVKVTCSQQELRQLLPLLLLWLLLLRLLLVWAL